MCESSVWVNYPGGRTEKIADDVLVVAQEGDMVVLRWLLAEPRCLRGRIVAVNAVKHAITLEAADSLMSIECWTRQWMRKGLKET